MSDIVEKALSGEALDVGDVEELMKEDIWILGRAAARLTESIFKGRVTFVSNMILNYTNVCTVACRFCAFYRPPGHPEAYVRSPEEAARAAAEVYRAFEIRQILVQGGVNPELDVEYYEEMFRRLKERVPDAAIHGLSPIEVDYLAKRGRMSYREVLGRLRDAGMDAMSGGGAEILDEEVRRVITPYKFNAEAWLRVQEEAHSLGIPTNATMLYGHIEEPRHIVKHISEIRDLQRKLHGVLTFIPVKFMPWNTQLHRDGRVKGPAPPELDIKVTAISRLMLAGEIPRISAYWTSVGKRMSSILLLSGANDLVGTMLNEEVLHRAGSGEGSSLDELAHIAREVGRRPVQRDTFQRALREL
ncbi:MAG: radical SAM protein [Conexivisphaera sp.]